MKLMLTSFTPSSEHDAVLSEMVGKPLSDIKMAYIENAYDVYNDEPTLIEGREILKNKGYNFEVVDLRDYKNDREGLRQKLASKDMFLFTGGNPYYLRWLMKITGADDIITELVKEGRVYSGASAGAVIAGPTLRFFDELDDPNEAEEIIWEGLNLTPIVIIPHTDDPDFGEGCRKSGELVKAAGYATQPLTNAQAYFIDGDQHRLM